ncbi:MAG: nucleotide sugar dehydrogenase, partial [Nitrososphaerota archaeon]
MVENISFFGLGYVGIVYSVGFASKGFQVTGFDIDRERVKKLGEGISPIHEPHLKELLEECISKRTLRVTDDPEEAVSRSDVTFITVGTPSENDGSVDLKHVVKASNMIGKELKDKSRWHLITVKSTVTPGTTENIVRKTIEEVSGKTAFKDFGLAVNPEFLREGSAVEDFMKPDRIIIGTNDEKSRHILEEIYSTFDCPKLVTNMNTAELIKYANNAFLAMKVSFINMIANLCQEIPGCDVEVVAKGIGLDRRIGEQFLRAGAGWGGSCLPKDLKAIRSFSNKLGLNLPLTD